MGHMFSSPSAWNHFGLMKTGFTLTETERFIFHANNAILQLCKGWRVLGLRLNPCREARKLSWGRSGSKWTTSAGGSSEAETYSKQNKTNMCCIGNNYSPWVNRAQLPTGHMVHAQLQYRLCWWCAFVTFMAFLISLCVYIRSNQHERQRWCCQILSEFPHLVLKIKH